jgi:hypothetical protein
MLNASVWRCSENETIHPLLTMTKTESKIEMRGIVSTCPIGKGRGRRMRR